MTTLVCLGDSITQGEGDAHGIGWVGRLNQFLHQRQPHHYTVYNLGISGDKIADCYHRYYNECLIRRPDLVLLAAGTNDCQKHHTINNPIVTPLDDAFRLWTKWAKDLHANRHQTVIIGVIPSDESFMPYQFDGEPLTWICCDDLQAYNQRLKEFSNQQQIPFIDLWDQWSAYPLTDYTEDGIHPNAKGYDSIAQSIITALTKLNLI